MVRTEPGQFVHINSGESDVKEISKLTVTEVVDLVAHFFIDI